MTKPQGPDATKYVLSSPEIHAAQRKHSRLVVGLPMVLALAGPLYLPAHVDWLMAAVLFFGMLTFTACLGISAGFHRHFAHRAFRAAPWLRALLIVAGQMTGQGPVMYWTALHRRHHSFADLPGDPHSPLPSAQDGNRTPRQAFWHAHFQWPTRHAVPMPSRYVADLLADPLVKRLNDWYYFCLVAGLVIPTVAGGLWDHSWQGALVGFYFGGPLRLTICTQGIWGLNSVCHTFGTRPHVTGDRSTNHLGMALVTYGEGWHNNHHHAPTHARFGHGPWQPDPTWWLLATLRRLGAVSGVIDENTTAASRGAQS